ncbi:MAG: hypothetical protein ABW007_15550 [Chitinophagaceae bacterium]
MSEFIHLLISHLKDTLFQPKDFFERSKRSAATRLLVPIVALVGGESIFIGILGALQTVEIYSGKFFFKLVAASSSSFITLALTILLAFAMYIGSNLYYSYRIKQSSEALEKLNRDLRRSDAYNVLKTKYQDYLGSGNTEQAYIVAGLMIKRFPDEIDMDGAFLESLLSAVETPQLTEIRRMLVEAPRSRGDGS